ncbi:TetR/AcrR family transcriptional regulator [Stutzerimonas urumqiensis]|uniref:TetR/AcrR family transcriptional regulator n=1 Tax=Stutzerimonas urumqiensis TaxID=638269 RepID=UPI003DA3960F
MSETVQSAGPGRPKDPAKREAILAAAKTLFLGNGYEGSSMEAIAAEAGVSKLTLYSHFKDKEALFCAAVQATCEQRLPSSLFHPAPELPIEQALGALATAFWSLVSSPESIGLHRLMITVAPQNPDMSRLFYEAGPQRVLQDTRQFLQVATSRGQLQVTDALKAAEHFCSLVKGLNHFHQLIGHSGPLDEAQLREHIADVVALFIRAYRP